MVNPWVWFFFSKDNQGTKQIKSGKNGEMPKFCPSHAGFGAARPVCGWLRSFSSLVPMSEDGCCRRIKISEWPIFLRGRVRVD
jgi:hypothetical protein